MRLFALALITACSAAPPPKVRRVIVTAPDDSYVLTTEPARCRVFCARFATAAEAATCQQARGSTEITEKYGAGSFIVCRLEQK